MTSPPCPIARAALSVITPFDVDRIVTIDRFHVAKLLGDKVDKERKKVVKQLKIEFENNEAKLNNIKQTMWPFRHHEKDLGVDEQIRLNYLFEMSPSLKKCYDFRESLFNIFELKISKEPAEKKIDEWIKSTEGYVTKGHNPFTSFIKTYKFYKPNILSMFPLFPNGSPSVPLTAVRSTWL